MVLVLLAWPPPTQSIDESSWEPSIRLLERMSVDLDAPWASVAAIPDRRSAPAACRARAAARHHGGFSGGSRFFITQLPQPQLEGKHTVFGQVITGMDVVDRILPGDIIREIVIWDGVTPPEEDFASGQP